MVTTAALQADVSDALDRAVHLVRQGDLAGAELELRRALWLRRLLDVQEVAVLAAMEADFRAE
jgi:hypothetical protein